jgi:hypothetical protein
MKKLTNSYTIMKLITIYSQLFFWTTMYQKKPKYLLSFFSVGVNGIIGRP